MIQQVREVPSSPFPIVLLHGYGSDEADLLGVGLELTHHHTIVTYRAPQELEQGYAWFGIEWTPTGIIADQDEAVVAREQVIKRLETFGTPVLLGGFSQGAILSLGIGWKRPDLVRGLVLMSGRPLPKFFEEPAASGFSELPIFISHGVSDPVIPIDQGRALHAQVKSSGNEPLYREYPMAHTISWPTIRDATDWLGTVS